MLTTSARPTAGKPAERLPTPHELAALTGDRDRVVDLIRICSLLVVVVGHSIMLTVDASGGSIRLGNTLGDVPMLQPATWLLQVLPLFFFAGAAASTHGWMSRASDDPPAAGHWLFTRTQRLLRPLGWYLGVVLVVLAGLTTAGLDAAADVVARLGVQLLWFLGAYLLVLAVVPLLQRIRTPLHVFLALGTCWGSTALIDAIRLHAGPSWLGYLNFLTVWTIPAVLGVAYAKQILRPGTAAAVSIGALILDTGLVHRGPYEISLVTVPGQQLSNMSPPSLLLAGHAIVLCAGAVAVRRVLATIAGRPRVWWWVVLGNRGAMTLYLWHLPVLAAVIVLGAVTGLDRADVQSASFPIVVGVQTMLLLALMVPVVVMLSPLEYRPLPWWDGPVARRAGRARDLTLLAALVCLGIAVLMVSRYGLLGDGIGWLISGIGCAVTGRVLALRPAARGGGDAVPGDDASLQVSASRRSTTLDESHRRR
ncbi:MULTISPECIES: acyltransferase family protein [Gordonia]|uniref:acyltransferase family protein n=1 Tax=Gordonia TaxID=2053 RepID=UPI0004ACA62D|nr:MULTISPECIES: acyltransferase [Gordonia]MDH3008128.1 acyltransferase [Gordonia alkanivorans]MDH3016804.1 acyltransferase [Gordonia alkanivorans]MDH3021001.1 acyltransferase [Gordonia alkanivorans]MDH3042049.1 acyltransferase [Gordonia alkanivorans]MDH3060567.1 acyltransferase [Gordonia alkanivorans]